MQEQLIALLGHPVAHSKSPLMHNLAFHTLGLPYRYLAFDVHPAHLAVAVQGLKALGFRGANVTVPHKIEVMPLLDDITPLAKQIGAVNTLYYDGGRLVGDNTDGQGYIASLLHEYPHLRLHEMTIGIVGAGGAARAVAYTLAHYGVKKMYITNRSGEKATALANGLLPLTDIEPVKMDAFATVTNKLNLLIQTTSVGMSPHDAASIVPRSWLHPDMIVSDLVYNPLHTRLLSDAREVGAKTHTGIGMLVHQGARAFELWTGEKPPVDAMRNLLIDSFS